MKFIVKISPEITIKSKFVRKQAIKLLARNIRKNIKKYIDDFEVNSMWDKIEIIIGAKNALIKDILQKIPGIEYFLEINEFDLTEIDDKKLFDYIFNITKDYFLDKIKQKTFSVRVKRVGNHTFRSIDLEKYIGGGLLKYSKEAKVKLKNPEIEVKLEIKDKKFYIIKQRYQSIGGYPIGFQDRVISLISGGFDSAVSTYLMMKRGCKVNFLFFNLGGNSHKLAVKQISYYLWSNFSYSYNAKFITIPFEEVVDELLTKINHRYRAIILKRLMLNIASRFYNYYAIVKGDSLGQVSSQTLKNMFVIDKASTNLVFRPLIGFNKQEIIDITKQIGTYTFSANIPEYCAVVSNKPSTGAKLEEVLKEEQNFDISKLEKAYENKEVEKLKDMINQDFIEDNIEITVLPGENDIIIDIRDKKEIKQNPLKIIGTEIKEIPFLKVKKEFLNLNKKKTYLLYCKKGIISKSLAEDLYNMGYKNIKIFKKLDNSSCKI